ncbi:MAG TPA: hypothetical protein VH231_16855 [Solirubrobacteraceae bacterium]|nr:hypothetical protein [Solirubrobacteraceae bacterium]
MRLLACTVLSLLVLAAPAFAQSKTGGGTAAPTTPPPAAAAAPAPAPTAGAALAAPGVADAPAGAPAAVRGAIRAGNALQALPYRYGGGHDTFADTAYDCSGAVSYALHGGRLLGAPMDSTELESWGAPGPGQWITVYANADHAFVVIAGLRLDTSAAGDPGGDQNGPRWRPAIRDTANFVIRHPSGV